MIIIPAWHTHRLRALLSCWFVRSSQLLAQTSALLFVWATQLDLGLLNYLPWLKRGFSCQQMCKLINDRKQQVMDEW